MNRSRPVCALAGGLLCCLAAARGENAWLPSPATHSASGQFVVSVAPDPQPFLTRPDPGTNAEILRLEPSLLAVSAERFKAALWSQLGLPASGPWSGRIFLVVRPARSLEEPVRLVAQPFLQRWIYRVELPDVITRPRCARALGAVLLLELANRAAPVNGPSANPPAWLVEGFAGQVRAAAETRVLLGAPKKLVNGIPQTRLAENRRGLDPLAGVRTRLQTAAALTFEQLSWPTGAQLNGDDGGVYAASAQLFVHDLLLLDHGPSKVRALLVALPAHANWQSAFFEAFRGDFRSPLDVEKWWSLRVVAFAMLAPGPQWSPAASRDQLETALVVPVNIRSASNALPVYAEISLQAVLQDFDPARQSEILQTRLRDLELIQFRLSPPLAEISAGYRQALADFLDERKRNSRRPAPSPKTLVKQLDALDARRRAVEACISAAPQ